MKREGLKKLKSRVSHDTAFYSTNNINKEWIQSTTNN